MIQKDIFLELVKERKRKRTHMISGHRTDEDALSAIYMYGTKEGSVYYKDTLTKRMYSKLWKSVFGGP